MNIEGIFAWSLLTCLIIWRELWHASVQSQLMDRLMARNFTELAQVETYRKQSAPKKTGAVEKKEDTDDYAAAQAAKANTAFGV